MAYEGFGYRPRDIDLRKPSFRRQKSGLSTGTIFLIVLGVKFGLVVLVLGCLGIGELISPSTNSPSKSSGNRQLWRGEISSGLSPEASLAWLPPDNGSTLAAFDFREGDVPPEDAAAIRAWVDSLKVGDRWMVEASFDGERMFQELERQGGFAAMQPAVRAERATSFRTFTWHETTDDWDRIEFKKICPLKGNGSEVAVVTTLHFRNDPRVQPQLWWLRRHGNEWRWYDEEYVDTRVPLSVYALLARPYRSSAAWVQNLSKFKTLIENGNDPEKVEKICTELEPLDQPPRLRLAIHLARADARLQNGKVKEVEPVLQKARELAPDHPEVLRLTRQLQRNHGEQEAALKTALRIVALFGGDAIQYAEIAQMHFALKRPDAAAMAYRQALDIDPSNAWHLAEFARALTPAPPDKLTAEQKRELSFRMQKLADKSKNAAQVFSYCDKSRTDAFEAFLDGYRIVQPKSLDCEYYSIRLQILRDMTEPACTALPKFLAKVDDKTKRETYVSGFLSAMMAVGKTLEGYKAAPDPKAAFRQLAEDLLEDGPEGDLRALVDLHAEKCADDVWLPYYRAELHQQKSAHADAEAELLKGLAQANLDKLTRDSYERSYVAVAFETGHGLEAYEKVENKSIAFDSLSWQFLNKQDAKSLGKLVDMHRKVDQNLALWDAQLMVLAKNYASAASILQVNRAAILQKTENRWQFKNLLVRSLAHQQKTAEALRELRGLDEKYHDRLLEALIHALAGDVAKTEQAMDLAVGEDGTTARYYSDPELGPILRSEPFKKLREKHPEPPPAGSGSGSPG